VRDGLNAVQAALMGIDLADPAAGVTRLKDVLGEWIALAARRFAPVPADTPAADEAGRDAAAGGAGGDDAELLDLSGVACPMNFVKTKIRLSALPVGSRLAVVLDDGAPIENVPLSLEEQGQKVLSKDRISDRQWKIVVEKVH